MSIDKELVTIITEAVLETALANELEQLGASGYTIFDVRGKGDQGGRGGEWKESANIEVKVICSEALADSITEMLQRDYFENYAMVVYRTQVAVLRSDKF